MPTLSRRAMIIGLDGLRPDTLRLDLMPTLAELIGHGTRLADHHAVYPTHTRVIVSSLATGAAPGRHGIVANVFRTSEAANGGLVNTADAEHLAALDMATGNRTIQAPTLGDILDAHDKRLAIAATSSPGAGILWNRLHPHRVVNVNSDYGRADLASLREKLGSVPPPGPEHRAERQMYAARAVTDLFLHDEDNQVIVLWMNEPDASQHFYGLGAPEVDDAMRACDQALRHVLDGLDRQGLRDQFDLFVISDHGHSTVRHHRNLGEYLDRARRDLGDSLPAMEIASDYIYPAGRSASAQEFEPLVRWLQEQPWAGVVFGSGALASLPGVLPLSSAWSGTESSRSPVLAVSPVWTEEANEHGVPGTVAALTEQVALKSTHGSLSPYELHAFGLLVGPDFREGVVSELPSGAIDIAPTVLQLLGYDVPESVDGRMLQETLTTPSGETPEPELETIAPKVQHPDGFTPALHLHRVGHVRYIDRGSNGRPE